MSNSYQHIIGPLVYFDIFHYPLTRDEIALYTGIDTVIVDNALRELKERQLVFAFDGFYTLENNEQLMHARRKANALATERMKAAAKSAAIIARFPYVQAVAVSGSLSKNFADEKTDIDFFIVTAPNRLWIARTFLHLLKKLSFVTGSQHLFCMNYFVDMDGLEIVEQNIFTATEIITLVPMHGSEALQQFMQANEWTLHYFAKRSAPVTKAKQVHKGWLVRLIQKCCNGAWGNRLDNYLLCLTHQRWQKKASRNQLNSRGIKMGMVVDKHFSKPDPVNFQQRVVRQYEEKMAKYANSQLLRPHLLSSSPKERR